MSNVDPEEVLQTTSDGVTVEKSFEPDDFPVPAIAFVVSSDRDAPVSIRLVDTVPDRVPPEDIGFHPKYGAEHWSVEDDTIVFERELQPDEEYTTVYGLRGGDAEDPEAFMSEPRLEEVESSDGEADQSTETSTDGSDEEDGDVSLDLPDPDGETPGVATTDDIGGDSTGTPADDGGPSPGPDATGQPSASAGPDDAGSFVSALAAEIRSDEVADEDLEELRDALGVDLASASVEARLEHLQSTVADLEAYADALEEFLDENGDGQRLIEGLTDDVERVEDRLDDLEADGDRLEEVESMAAEAADTASSVDERLGDVEETVEEAADTASTVDDRLDEELDELWSSVDEAAADAADASSAVEDLRGDVEALDDDLGEVEDDVDDEVTERVEELESEIEDLEGQLSELSEMRERLASALGGLGGTDEE